MEYKFTYRNQNIVIVHRPASNEVYWNGEYMFTDCSPTMACAIMAIKKIILDFLK